MKKNSAIIVSMLVCTLLTSCGQKAGGVLPENLPVNFTFTSGVGAWSTSITLEIDGTFSGEYHDSDMGDSSENYPSGTIYVCDFSGRFSEIEKVDENSYSMTLEEVSSDYENGKERIENGVRYVSAEPYGVEDGNAFILYLPGTMRDGLNEDFLSWWQYWFLDGEQAETLGLYGLYNVKMGYGFFG